MKYYFTKNVKNELKKEKYLTWIRTCDLQITRPTFYHRAMLDDLQTDHFFYILYQKNGQKFANQQKMLDTAIHMDYLG